MSDAHGAAAQQGQENQTMTAPSMRTAHEARASADREEAFWQARHEQLLASHAERFVAVKDGEVIAAESDLTQLILLLSTLRIDIKDTWVRFITAEPNKLLLSTL